MNVLVPAHCSGGTLVVYKYEHRTVCVGRSQITIKNTLQVSEKEPKLTHVIVNESLLTDNNTYINIVKLFLTLNSILHGNNIIAKV